MNPRIQHSSLVMFDRAWELGRLYDIGSVTKPSLS
jgi:hypothetical protein